jgi:ubiquitin-protein ligase
MESSELLTRIREEIQQTIQTPAPEWKTVAQWGAEWGLQRAQTNRLITEALRAGIMEGRKFRIRMPFRTSYPVPHYRQKIAP